MAAVGVNRETSANCRDIRAIQLLERQGYRVVLEPAA